MESIKNTSALAHLANITKYNLSARTLIDTLEQRTIVNSDFLYFMDMKNHPHEITAEKIYTSARSVAQYLMSRGLRKEDKVIIMLPTCMEFPAIYFGILMAGGIPVPVSQPAGTSNLEKYLNNLKHIIINSEARYFVTLDKMMKITASLMNASEQMEEFIFISDIIGNSIPESAYKPFPEIFPSDIALIQYTSGTTGKPKGVLLSHENLLHNIHGIGVASQLTKNDVGISWLPLYHDMGLIGGFLTALYCKAKLVLMSPEAFLFKPQWWMENIAKFGVSIGVAPNFGYHYCVTRIPEEALQGLDLSTWRLAMNGAEPIDRVTLQKFIEKFRPCGLREDIFLPVYGMAENSLAATFPSLDQTTVVRRFLREKLEFDHFAIDTDSSDSKIGIDLVAVGTPLVGQEIRIADENGSTLPIRHVGEILVKSPSLTQGYYKNQESTDQTIIDGWLHTGDLGFISEGLLFISGRKKEMIIKRGKNIYPYDVERIASSVKGVRLGACAAFAMYNNDQGTEDLVLLCETLVKGKEALEQMKKEISNEILARLGIKPDDIKLVPKGTIPKTTSGKIQRILCKKIYLEGDLISRKSKNYLVLSKTLLLSYYNFFFSRLFK